MSLNDKSIVTNAYTVAGNFDEGWFRSSKGADIGEGKGRESVLRQVYEVGDV